MSLCRSRGSFMAKRRTPERFYSHEAPDKLYQTTKIMRARVALYSLSVLRFNVSRSIFLFFLSFDVALEFRQSVVDRCENRSLIGFTDERASPMNTPPAAPYQIINRGNANAIGSGKPNNGVVDAKIADASATSVTREAVRIDSVSPPLIPRTTN